MIVVTLLVVDLCHLLKLRKNVGSLALMVLFILDAIQVRGAVQPEAIRQFDIGVIKAVLKLATGAAAFTWLGLRGVRTRAASRRAGPDAGLIRAS